MVNAEFRTGCQPKKIHLKSQSNGLNYEKLSLTSLKSTSKQSVCLGMCCIVKWSQCHFKIPFKGVGNWKYIYIFTHK